MLLSIQRPLATFSVLSAVLSIVSADNDFKITKPGCAGVNRSNYNITGWEGAPGFNWTTGLFSDGPRADVTQAFWINSTSDFYSRNSDEEGCAVIIYGLPDDAYTKLKGRESCEKNVIGDQCGTDLRNEFGGPANMDQSRQPTCSMLWSTLTKIPDSCTNLKGASFEVVTVTDGGNNNFNDTCSTENNPTGSKSAFLTLTKSTDDKAADFSTYDAMARQAFVIVNSFYRYNKTEGGGYSIGAIVKSDCLYNDKITDGSRVPESMKEQPSPTPSPQPSDPAKGAASAIALTGVTWAIVMGAAVLLF